MQGINSDVVLLDLTPAHSRLDEDIVTVNGGLRSITAYLRGKGIETHLFFDLFYGTSSTQKVLNIFIKQIVQKKPLVLGFSPYQAWSGEKRNDMDIISQIVNGLHQRGCRPFIALGGHFATFNADDLMRDFRWVDFIVKGEGEETLEELLRTLKGRGELRNIAGLTYRVGRKWRTNPLRSNIADLDKLPMPVYDHMEYAKRNGIPIVACVMTSSRGCYGRCSFCSVQSFYKYSPGNHYWRSRSPEKVVDEIEFVRNQYGCRYFRFLDDNFMGPGKTGRARAAEIAKEILRRKLKIEFVFMCRANDVDVQTISVLQKAGLRSIAIGIESGSEEALKIYSKGTTCDQNKRAVLLLDKLGIEIAPTFIFLNPYSTLSEIRDNIQFYRFTKSIKNVRWPSSFMLVDLHLSSGLPILEKLRKDSLLKGNYLDGYSCVFRDPSMRYIKKICDLFAHTSFLFGDLFSRINLVGTTNAKRALTQIHKLPKIRTHVCCDYAIELVEKAVDILQNSSCDIKFFMENVERELNDVNLWLIAQKMLLS